MQIAALADGVMAAVRGYVARNMQALAERIATLEARPAPERGEKGDPGERGEPGAPGRDGADGKPADPAEIEAVVRRAIESLPKPTDGKDGRDGADGKDGSPGEPGAQGEPGERGEKGDPGEPGRDGRDGEPGRDALQLDVIDSIDPERRYQRNTFAAIRGGLVRSFRLTDPLPDGGALEKAGWHVIFNATAEDSMEQRNERTFVRRIVHTDGHVVESTLSLPTLLDRGVWREDHAYERGDGVTWGGSFWIAQRDTTDKPGDGPDNGWRMAIKKGTEGRSAYESARRAGFDGSEAEWVKSLQKR